ncbi:hypothetical protein QW131_05835 [Roseibium salinum]|nr:hypothetical protein [Roseibium salinum]
MTHVSPDLVNDIRAASRRLVREFGFLDKTIAGTDLSGSGVHAILEIGLNPGLTAKDLVARLKLEKNPPSAGCSNHWKRAAKSNRPARPPTDGPSG